jgi:hypothetical protein
MFTTVLFVSLYPSHLAVDDTLAPCIPTTHAGSSKLVLSSHGLWLQWWTVSEAQTSAGILSATGGAHVMISVILLLIYLGSVLMIKHKASGTLSDDQKHMNKISRQKHVQTEQEKLKHTKE